MVFSVSFNFGKMNVSEAPVSDWDIPINPYLYIK